VNINAAVQDAQHLIRNVDAQIQPLSTELTATLRDSRTLIGHANEQIVALGTNLNQAVGDGRSLIHQAGENISDLSREFQEAMATVSRGHRNRGGPGRRIAGLRQGGLRADVSGQGNVAGD
jgi:paraquat-inducible protein B